MAKRPRLRVLLEAGCGGAAGALGLLTLVWRDWVEAILGIDPDRHGGSFEWLIVAGLLCVALVLGGAARADWRRTVRSTAPDLDSAR